MKVNREQFRSTLQKCDHVLEQFAEVSPRPDLIPAVREQVKGLWALLPEIDKEEGEEVEITQAQYNDLMAFDKQCRQIRDTYLPLTRENKR
jgi:hypothetical protein